jgi:UDP-N-acetylglucosamine--N-acetylmuramyl-(pentapeptide) pyrophosphoryl-undecaprenol N-acetylglucosamine transferase
MRSDAKATMGLDPDKALVLVLGGSQGARAINQAVEASESLWLAAGHQILWQCGKFYHEDLSQRLPQQSGRQLKAFIKDMPTAYRAADVIISRAGAGTLSELAAVAAAAILIPSPNVAEDHQSHNARSLSDQGAALLLPENDVDDLGNMVTELLADSAALDGLRSAALRMAKPHASASIVQQLEGLLS